MRCLGGHELAAIAGAVIAARIARVPVLLDGFASDGGGQRPAESQPRRPRSLPGGALLGGTGASRKLLEKIGKQAFARSRHAAGRSLRRGARHSHRPRGGHVPCRHGDLRRSRRQRQGLGACAIQ